MIQDLHLLFVKFYNRFFRMTNLISLRKFVQYFFYILCTVLCMTLTNRDKVIIRRIIDEFLTTRDELVNTLNRFNADTNDVKGIIGWKIIRQIAGNSPEYRSFIDVIPDEFESRNEIGEYVYDVIREKIGF